MAGPHTRPFALLTAAVAIFVTLTVAPSTIDQTRVDAAPSTHEPGDVDIDFRGDFTYTVDPAAGVVHVRASLYLAHNNRAVYYTAHPSVAYVLFNVPANAVIVHSAQHGPVPQWQAIPDRGRTVTAIKPRPIAGDDNYIRLEIDLRCCLNYTYHLQLVIEYDIPGLPPRSPGATRANGAYFGFDAYTVGDSDVGSITVITPSSYVIDTLDSAWSQSTVDGTTTYRLDRVPDANARVWYVAAHDESKLVDATITSGEADFRVRAWPGDTEWSPFVSGTLTSGLPILEQLVGQPWPIASTVDITESYTPYAFGYAGWFSTTDHSIELGERLDHEVVLHEVSHAWFNSDWFGERWLGEGFAQMYSNLAAAELVPAPTVTEPEQVDSAAAGHVLLDEWNSFDVADSDADEEDYGYNASWYVVQQVADDIGLESMAEVIADIADKTPSYPGDATTETTYARTDSRRFLDLVERHGASSDTRDLFEELVLTPVDAALLDDRADARSAYTALETAGGEWAPPRSIREDMAEWKFDTAQSKIATAMHIIDLRDQLDIIAAEAGLTYSDTLETSYENAHTSLDKVQSSLADTLATAQHVLDAVRAERASHGALGTIGLIGSDLSSTIDDARAALATGDLATTYRRATTVIDEIDSSTTDGTIRLAVLLGLALVVATVWIRRRHRPEAPEPTPDLTLPE